MERITLLLFQAQAGVFLFSFRFDAENLRCLCLTFFYYINTSELPSELSRENFISSRDHYRYGYIVNRAFESKLIWYFTGVYIINRIVKYKRHVLVVSSCSTRYLTRSLRSFVRYRVDHSKIKFISTRGHVISSVHLFNMQKYILKKISATGRFLTYAENF